MKKEKIFKTTQAPTHKYKRKKDQITYAQKNDKKIDKMKEKEIKYKLK
jgi:hypothetical protein